MALLLFFFSFVVFFFPGRFLWLYSRTHMSPYSQIMFIVVGKTHLSGVSYESEYFIKKGVIQVVSKTEI